MKKRTLLSIPLTLLFIFCNSSCDQIAKVFNKKKHQSRPIDTVLYNHPTNIEFRDTMLNLGTIKKGSKASLTYYFKNSGDKPLMLFNVIPGCGCTISEYSFQPILPGNTDSIVSTFDSDKKEGPYIKSITVQANTEQKIHRLYFKVNVEK